MPSQNTARVWDDGLRQEMPVRTNHRRQINDDRGRVFGENEASRLIAFVCECGESDCHRTVLLRHEEYLARRSGVIVRASHEPPLTPPQ